jgi:undecaprenyl diphosphate synthase
MIEHAAVVEAAVPRHVAVIMDGNRRWARERGLTSKDGHRAGGEALHATVSAAARAGIEVLTVYAFSEENWQRGEREVGALMSLVRYFAMREARPLQQANVRVRAIGRIGDLPHITRAALDALVDATKSCTGMLLNLALNYGARGELGDAMRAIAHDVRDGRLDPDTIDDELLSDYLYTKGLPDPDLLIRTGGELRVSNFLLYQIAYAELWSTRAHWPDFGPTLLDEALSDYARRRRRFGT